MSLASRQGGILAHLDSGSFSISGRHLEWGPDGKMALSTLRTTPTEVIQWPESRRLASLLPSGRYCWTDSGVLARATRARISTLNLLEGGWEESGAISPPPGERWVWVHGLGKGAWAALRWNQSERTVGLSQWRGGQWSVDHLRLPQVESLLPTKWDWAADNESWILLAPHDRILTGWTFPQGLEWLRRISPTQAACLSEEGVFWAEGETVIHLDRVSQEVSEWSGHEAITGMAWNQRRRCLALASRKGVDVLLA